MQNSSFTKNSVYDVLVVGSGIAGMYASLQFGEDVRVLTLSKYEKTVSNSNLAQGGVAAVLSFEDDSFDLHTEDTLIAGNNSNNLEAVDILVREGPDDVNKLIDLGIIFDRNPDGSLDKTLEGGHSRRRIMHYKDCTGAEIVTKLLQRVQEKTNIELCDMTVLCGLTRVRSGFRADLLKNGQYTSIFCSYCILCTGGIGRVYKYTTNPKCATGDGIHIAYELGAKIKNLSYIQFHPTAFRSDDGEQFLISESVRGEGAYLLNNSFERFMHRYDKRLELAPRDVVSKSIILESRRTGSNEFYLDITHKPSDYILNRFPAISEGCKKHGVDITKDKIPIFPCQHYLMGGIEVDIDSRTTIPRLYAAGECANTGVHGKNRLASNSLLEALVYSRRAAEDIKRFMDIRSATVAELPFDNDYSGAPLPKGIVQEIQAIMQRSYFVLPDPGAVRMGLQQAQVILKRLHNGKFAVTSEYCEALSMSTIACIILKEVDES